MKYILLLPAVIIYILMRWCEMGAKFFGKLNDRFIDYWVKNSPN